MKWDSKNNTPRRRAFTMIEVTVALVILGMIAATVLVIINKAVDTVVFWQTKMQAFEIARENMELLLSKPSVTDMLEYGTSETNPDINWETTVEAFYEPVTSRMWVRAVCSAEFPDADGQPQKIELTQWLTGLSQAQIIKIIEQQKKLEQYQMTLDDFLGKMNDKMAENSMETETDTAQQNYQQRDNGTGSESQSSDSSDNAALQKFLEELKKSETSK